MCWSNLQAELVQQASPLKGLMQCQNLWLRGQPLFLPPQSDKSWISFPRHSFLFSLLLNSSWREAWDGRCEWNIFIRRQENPRSETRPRLIWASDVPSNPHHLFFFFSHVLLSFASCHSRRCASRWLKSAACQGRHISERHKTCRNINKQQATDSSQATRGRLGLGGGRCAVEVSSSGPEEDKIKSIGLSPGSSCSSDREATGTPRVRWSVRGWVRVAPSRSCVAFGGIIEPDDAPAASCTIRFILIKNKRKFSPKNPISYFPQ